MRPMHVPVPRLLPTTRQPVSSRREADEKPVGEAKPPKKRSLNEGAHKLGY
jgi:hypothetical protein